MARNPRTACSRLWTCSTATCSPTRSCAELPYATTTTPGWQQSAPRLHAGDGAAAGRGGEPDRAGGGGGRGSRSVATPLHLLGCSMRDDRLRLPGGALCLVRGGDAITAQRDILGTAPV